MAEDPPDLGERRRTHRVAQGTQPLDIPAGMVPAGRRERPRDGPTPDIQIASNGSDTETSLVVQVADRLVPENAPRDGFAPSNLAPFRPRLAGLLGSGAASRLPDWSRIASPSFPSSHRLDRLSAVQRLAVALDDADGAAAPARHARAYGVPLAPRPVLGHPCAQYEGMARRSQTGLDQSEIDALRPRWRAGQRAARQEQRGRYIIARRRPPLAALG